MLNPHCLLCLVAIGFKFWWQWLCWWLGFQFSEPSPRYSVPVIQSVLQGRVYHRLRIFLIMYTGYPKKWATEFLAYPGKGLFGCGLTLFKMGLSNFCSVTFLGPAVHMIFVSNIAIGFNFWWHWLCWWLGNFLSRHPSILFQSSNQFYRAECITVLTINWS